MTERTAQVIRETLETQISIDLNIDGTGKSSFDTGVPFLEHMLEQVARHRARRIADGVGRRLRPLGGEVVDDHPRAFRSQPLRNRAADARPRSGDDGAMMGETAHSISS